MAIKIEMLRCFCAVAKAGNLSDAASRLGRTQSAVSMSLKQLEANLGSPLFESERKNRLTALGEQVFQLGEKQLKHFDSSISAMELLAQAPQGVLRVSAVPSVAALAFPPLVRHLTSNHPGLKIELRDADSPSVIEALVQGWADIGIASTHHVLNGIETAPLSADNYGLVLSEAHPLAQSKAPLAIEDIFGAPFLRNALCDQIETQAFRDHLGQTDVTVHNTQSLLAMVLQGDWVTVLPQSVLGLAPTGLAFRPIKNLPDVRQVFLYTRDQSSHPKATQDARQKLTDLLNGNPVG